MEHESWYIIKELLNCLFSNFSNEIQAFVTFLLRSACGFTCDKNTAESVDLSVIKFQPIPVMIQKKILESGPLC